MLAAGQRIELAVEKPAAGGRMIARHEGQVVLVHGAIPGEVVIAEVERVERQLAFARTVDVRQAASDRRAPSADPDCGGSQYSHIAYTRQLTIKAAVIEDAFARLGKLPLAEAVTIAASEERGYRIRARLHARGRQVGFYREGTHDLCDAAATGQLTGETVDAVARLAASLDDAKTPSRSIEVSEDVSGRTRAALIATERDADITAEQLALAAREAGFAGAVLRTPGGRRVVAGDARVVDPLTVLTRGRARSGTLGRGPESFFQGNRHLLPDLVTAVLDAVGGAEAVIDAYAGVGLFAVALAATGHTNITAVEGDRASGADLRQNAEPFGSSIQVLVGRVEDRLDPHRLRPTAVVVDPPRTGISRDALRAILRISAPLIVYVSCDPPTMARDARRLVDAGYRLDWLRGFDLFPNTPHVEVVGVFGK